MAFMFRYILILQCLLIPAILTDNNNEQKKNYLKYFLDYMNNLPDQLYAYEDGILVNVQEIAANVFNIEANVKVSEVQNPKKFKLLRCTGRMVDSKASGLSMVRDSYYCQEDVIEPNVVTEATSVPETDITQDDYGQTTEALFIQRPVKLDNEVQPDNAATSGEQFIAIPRVSPSPCIGCSSHVDVAAAGVQELAILAVRHLDSHEPNVKHILKSVADVERQVQAVNGVRFILTLLIGYNNCSIEVNDNCQKEKACKISILEKPWLKLPDGSKFRAIMSNNCTDEWIFGDNGEVLPPVAENTEDNDLKSDSLVNNHHDGDNKPTSDHDTTNTGSGDNIIKVHEVGLQSQTPSHQRHLTDEELKILQDQIIPINQFNQLPEVIQVESLQQPIKSVGVNELSSSKEETEHTYKEIKIENENKSEESTQGSISDVTEQSTQGTISDDKKHAIDDLMKFFDIDINSAGFSKDTDEEQTNLRTKRNYNYDLNVYAKAQRYRKLKRNIDNANYMYKLAKHMVDYVNDMDLENKNRVLQDVVQAEEETENNLKFVYIQARAISKCDKVSCSKADLQSFLCKAVIETTKHEAPVIMEAFCNKKDYSKENIGKINIVSTDDPIIVKFATDALKKMEAESNSHYAMRLLRVIDANTQVSSGIITKITLEIAYLDCNRSIPLVQRVNCSNLSDLRTKLCDVTVHNTQWMKDIELEYFCTDRLEEEAFRNNGGALKKLDTNTSNILNMAEEALQHLIFNNKKNSKPKIVNITFASSQVVAGLLTHINFQVGFTKCADSMNIDSKTCELLPNEPLRNCTAHIWERVWLEDGKLINATCEDIDDNEFEPGNYNSLLRSKRNANLTFIGGPQEQDPKDIKYLNLAKDALTKYQSFVGNGKVHDVIEINRVTTKLVAGILTEIDFKIGETCAVDADKCKDYTKKIGCKAKIWDRSWLPDGREFNVNCEDINQSDTNVEHKSTTKKKREVVFNNLMHDDADLEYYKLLAQESLEQYQLLNNVEGLHTIVKVDHVELETSPGTLRTYVLIDFHIAPSNCKSNDEMDLSKCIYQNKTILSCHSKIKERMNLYERNDITVYCKPEESHLNRRTGMPGGIIEDDPTLTKYFIMAELSLQTLYQQSNVKHVHKVIGVDRVTNQVVAGLLTKIDFRITPTTCLLANTLYFESNCVPKTPMAVIRCQSQVWDRPWLAKNKEVKITCSDSDNTLSRGYDDVRFKRRVEKKNRNLREYKLLAKKALQKYELLTNPEYSHRILKINRVTTEVVDTILTKLYFTISPTVCRLKTVTNVYSTKCPFQDPSIVIACVAEVWDVISEFYSMSDENQIQVECINAWELRQKRNVLLGGVTDQDPDNGQYKLLAEESLQQYHQLAETEYVHKINKLDKVTTQVVQGMLTKLYFSISPTTCRIGNVSLSDISKCDVQSTSDDINCISEVWERPWLPKPREIVVNCNDKTSKDVEAVKEEEPASSIGVDMEQHFRAKRGVMVGGEQIQDVDKHEYTVLAEEALRKYESISNSEFSHKVSKIDSVKTQVVAGSLTNIDFTVLETVCATNNVPKIEIKNCDLRTPSVGKQCHAEIWDRPWLNSRKKITVNCKKSKAKKYMDTSTMKTGGRSKRQASKDVEAVKEDESANSEGIDKEQHIRSKFDVTPGGLTTQDVNKHEYTVLAEEALRRHEYISNSKYWHKVSKVDSVKTQVVAGSLTKIDFTVLETVCATNKVSKLEINKCDLKTPSVGKQCRAKIWDRPWLKNRQIDVSCNKSKAKKYLHTRIRPKRLAIGQDDEDDYIDEDTRYYYADRALQFLNSQSDTNNLYKVVSIYSMQSSYHMKVMMIRMYMDVALTFCTKDEKPQSLDRCDEMNGVNHRTCLARLWPSAHDELVLENINVVCEDDEQFSAVAGFSVNDLIDASLKKLEESPKLKYKLIPRGEAKLIPSLDSNDPIKLTFIVSSLNCTKDVARQQLLSTCFFDQQKPSRECHSYIWLAPNERRIHDLKVVCLGDKTRVKRSINFANTTSQEENDIKKFVADAISKLEMSNLHPYKQRLIRINSYTTKLTSGRQTTIDFDVGYTTCMKYEWVQDMTTCNFLEHLPRRHCLATVWQRLWVANGHSIEVSCDDDETPLEAHIEFENANATMELAKNALKHIEAKYPHPYKQKIVRVFSLEKQMVAGIHYRMKMEVGYTDCPALTVRDDCNVTNEFGLNKFCRVNIWLRPWVNHGANYRVSCDYKEAMTAEIYKHVQAEHLFGEFIKTYKPDYIDDWVELAKRFEIFKDNVKKIHEFNTHDKGTATYAVTRFTDLTYEEFKSKYLGLRPGLRDLNQIPMPRAVIPNVDLPDKFDWRDKGAVTEVKNQGSCGSCWAFSVTGNIEGQWKLKTGQLLSLSEQELVDCDKLDEGCNGGLPDNAYRAIEQLGGLETENDYPYEGEDDKCEYNKTLSRVQISGAVNISSNETEMAKWLLKHGPISIGINANAMQFYVGGVSHPWKVLCNPENLDHGVLIVGYGIKEYPLFNKKLPYWIVKNSWGESWGEQGYYRVYRGDGTCGVNMMASSSVI